MKYLISFLTLIQGKKATVVAILALILSYLAAKGVIGEAEQVLSNGVLTLVALGANYATKKYLS
jgi:hypothetical protein